MGHQFTHYYKLSLMDFRVKDIYILGNKEAIPFKLSKPEIINLNEE